MGRRSSNYKMLPRGEKVYWDDDRTPQSHCQGHYFTPGVSWQRCYFLKENSVFFHFLKQWIFFFLNNAKFSFWRDLERQVPSIVMKGTQVPQSKGIPSDKAGSTTGLARWPVLSLPLKALRWGADLGSWLEETPLTVMSPEGPGLRGDTAQSTRAVVSQGGVTPRGCSPQTIHWMSRKY